MNNIDVARDIVKMGVDKKSDILLEGISGSGKTTIAIDRYRYLIERLNVRSEEILVFVSDRSQSFVWRNNLDIKKSGAIKIGSFFGFIQKELKKFWPLVLKNNKSILFKGIRPVFMTFESSQCVAKKIVEKMINENKFIGITSTADRIAIKVASAITRITLAGIDFNEAGERLKLSMEDDNEMQKSAYDDFSLALNYYVKESVERGIIDYGMAGWLYYNYLFNDEEYKKHLLRENKYIIVDNLEDCSPIQIDLIDFIRKNGRSSLLVYNSEGGFEKYGGNKDYTESTLFTEELGRYKLDGNIFADQNMVDFANILGKNVLLETDKKVANRDRIIVDTSYELRSEMVEKVALKIEELIDSGVGYDEIAIICPDNDIVLEYIILKRVIEKRGLDYISFGRKSKAAENKYINALIVLAMLVYDFGDLKADFDDLRIFFNSIFKMDLLRASMLATCAYKIKAGKSFLLKSDEIDVAKKERIGFANIEKYTFIREWIEELKGKIENIEIDQLFRIVYMDILAKLPDAKENIMACRNMIDSAENFISVLKEFKESKEVRIEDFNYEFIQFIRGGAKAAESFFEIEEKFSKKYLTISTPFLYHNGARFHKVQIWVDVTSDGWTPKNVNEFENPYVLSRTWNKGNVYDFETELKNKKRLMQTIISTVIKKCSGTIFFYGSRYSLKGYEQESLLFDGILNSIEVE